MQALLVGGAVLLILALVCLAVIVKLSVKRGEAKADEQANATFNERRRDADEVMAEPVADEDAWVHRQRERALARRKLRELQRRSRGDSR